MSRTARILGSVALLAASLAAQAVTLGEARVKSYLNQPLEAEIDLVGLAPGQHADLRLRVANQDSFERLGIIYTPTLAGLEFDVVQSGNRWLVRVRSRDPVIEPFIDFPLLMRWPGGQMIRQYTWLLDPQRPIRTASAAATSRVTPQAGSPTREPVTNVASAAAAGGDFYGPVKRGETLWPIAQRLKPAGITTRQMAMALLRANPDAFIDGDINKLRAGARLEVPARAFIEELDAKQASDQFAAATRQRRAAVATSPRKDAAASAEPVALVEVPESAPPTAKPSTPPAQAGEDARLRIVGEQDNVDRQPGSEADLQEKLLVTMEEIESNRLTTDAIESRLARLEAELQRMQTLVALKDAQIAALETEADAKAEAARQATTAPAPVVSPTEAAPVATAGRTGDVSPAAPIVVEAAAPGAAATPASAFWKDGYLWLVWVGLGLLGLASILLMARRRQSEPVGVSDVNELPAIARTPSAPPEFEPTPPAPRPAPARPRDIEADLRAVADARLPGDDPDTVELPELDLSALKPSGKGRDPATEDISESVLAEMLEETQLAPNRPRDERHEADFNDDDIASWIRELGGNDTVDTNASEADRLVDNDEIPSILSELDDQLATGSASEFGASTRIELEPVEDPVQRSNDDTEDDAFRMSLDLARAYLEIGDNEGARDMLQQALGGARNADHRRQIEDLLRQIG